MQNITANRVNMTRTTLNHCTLNPTPTSGIPAFAIVMGTAVNKLILIDQLTQFTNRKIIDVTLDTNLIRIAMSDFALKCGDALSAYAASVNNNILRGQVNFTLAKLNKFKKDEVDDICQTIKELADANILLAGAFGYDATNVSDLDTAIILYRSSMQNPREFTISKKQANAKIKVIVREIIDNLFTNQMDKMVNTVKKTYPDFVQSYYFAREIINIGSTTAKVRGIIRNDEGTYLVGVKFYIVSVSLNQKVAETLSLAGGKYGIANIPADDYDLHWEFPGYQPFIETNLHIPAGKEFTRNKTLKHIVISGAISSGQLINIFGPSNPEWHIGATIKIKNTSSASSGTTLAFFPADNPGDGFSGSGSQLTPGQEETHTITAPDFKPYVNIQNQGPNSGTYEITIL